MLEVSLGGTFKEESAYLGNKFFSFRVGSKEREINNSVQGLSTLKANTFTFRRMGIFSEDCYRTVAIDGQAMDDPLFRPCV